MRVPSYDDLTPPIPDVLASEAIPQLARFLGATGVPAAQDAPVASRAPQAHAPRALYACLHASGDLTPVIAIARDFSPRIMCMGERDVVLDVSGLGRLIGEPPAIAAELAREVREAGVSARIAIAPTGTGARLLVRHAVLDPSAAAAQLRRDLASVVTGDVAGSLAALPVTLLRDLEPLPPKINERDRVRPYETFERWGIATLGDLAALPAADVASRLSRRGVILQRLARGEDLRPFVPDADTPRYIERLELEWPIDGLEPLSFVLARLLDVLAAGLERADRGAAAIRLDLRLTDRQTHRRVLQLPVAMRDSRVLRTLLLLDLESHPPSPLSGFGESGPASAAIDIVTIEIDPAPARITQFSLLDRALPSPETLSTLTARLNALVGESRIGSAVLLDTHASDAFDMARFAPSPQAPQPCQTPEGPQPPVLRRQRIPPAIRVRVEHGRPVHVAAARRGMPGGAVTHAAGPWRASGGWWVVSEGRGASPSSVAAASGAPRALKWSRDEWDVALADGAVCRIHQDRATGCWHLEGVYD